MGVPTDGNGQGLTSGIVQLIAAITVLSLAPSILVMTTSFVRIVVVLSLLRTAIGLQNAPPNSVVISLALFLTAFVMAPTFMQSYNAGIAPYMAESITLEEAIPLTLAPVQAFMGKHANPEDVALFAGMANITDLPSAEAAPFQVLAPAFMISELKRAFEIGFMVFLPFLVIDLVVSSILMAMGMMMLPPVTISLPFKLIFFVLVDGWRMLAGSLVESFMAGAAPT
jgi:flagellar biosynthetic protein FliP